MNSWMRELSHVERGLAGDRDADVVSVAELVERLGGVDHRLGRDAADVEAHAADVLALDDGGLDLELTEPDRGRIAARSSSDDNSVETMLGHARVIPRSPVRGSLCGGGLRRAGHSRSMVF